MAENISSMLLYDHNTGEYPVLTLAYMGDAVLEMLSREFVLKNSGAVKPGQLVKASKAFITCEAQSDAVEKILPLLTDEEEGVFKRGRRP
jgi:ribonuclease-3 family protein